MSVALIFDFDGTILDTEKEVYAAWQRVYAEHGQPLPSDEWLQVVGRASNHRDFHAELEQLIGRELDRDGLKERRMREIREALDGEPPRPGVTDAIEAATRAGHPLAVVSGSGREWVEGHLKRLGLRDAFGPLICRGDTPFHKPHPQPFLAASYTLQVAPNHCIVVEDSPNGATAAIKAGMLTIVAPNQITAAADFSKLRIDVLVDDLAGLDWHDLFERARTRDYPRRGKRGLLGRPFGGGRKKREV